MRVRVSATVLGFLEGTQAWADIGSYRRGEPTKDDENVVHLFNELDITGRRSDGSVVLDLVKERALILREYAEYLESAARDGAHDDPSARGEVNAARALIRQIDRGGL